MKPFGDRLSGISDLVSRSKAHIVFLILGSIFGLSFLIITPPFQVPDETNHFLKAYQISTGQLKGLKEDNRVGGYIPHAVDSFSNSFAQIQGAMHTTTKKARIWKLRSLQIDEADLIFVDFPSTGKYSFVNYLPQSFSIYILKNLFSNVMLIYYGSKLFTLSFWLACITLAIYIIPFHKWLFTAIALLPMSIFINSSLSGDVVTNATSFLLIAYLLKMAYGPEEIKRKHLLIVGFLGVVLASTKLVYTPLLLLFLLIPTRKFSSRSSSILSFGGILFLTLATSVYWYHVMDSIYIPYSDYNEIYREGLNVREGVNASEQIQFLKGNPSHISTILSNATGSTFEMVREGYIGVFGWLETRIPLWLIGLSYLVIFTLALSETKTVLIKIGLRDRLIFLTTFGIILFLIIITLFITWTLIGADYVHIQGRYLIPAGPLLFMIFYRNNLINQSINPVIVVLFTILSLSVSFNTLANRFYVDPVFNQTDIICGAENVVQDLFTTSEEGVFLANANTRTNEEIRTGSYSVKVDPDNPFSFTFKTKEIRYGDVMHIEIWRKGEDAALVLESDNLNKLYNAKSVTDSTDQQGWKRIKINHVFKERTKGEEIAIYVYNYGKNTVYFDDLKITILSPIK